MADTFDEFVGTWQNSTNNLEMTFYSDGSYKVNNNNFNYSGTLTIVNPYIHYVKMNWEGYENTYMVMFLSSENTMTIMGVESGGIANLEKVS